MKLFEITTPLLKSAANACAEVLSGAVDGPEAKNRIGAANSVIGIVNSELKVRLAMPKIAAAEAKMIEHSEGRKAISA